MNVAIYSYFARSYTFIIHLGKATNHQKTKTQRIRSLPILKLINSNFREIMRSVFFLTGSMTISHKH